MQSTYSKQKLVTESDNLVTINSNIHTCTKCELHCNTLNSVPPLWKGDLSNIKVMFIGEGPGATEDLQGKPFVGRAGQLLQQLLYEINLVDNIYITNVVKHRPPKNRKPTQEEMSICGNLFLEKEIEIINPKQIICLGRTAAEYLLALATHNEGHTPWRGSLRGKAFKYKEIDVTCTWHPAYVLRQPEKKIELKQDLLKLK